MKTFIAMFLVKPKRVNEHFKTLKAACVTIWGVAENSSTAELAAIKSINDDNREIVSVEEKMRETTLEDCPSPEATERFLKAQTDGVSAFYMASGVDSSGKNYSFN